jgi:hypothetical protein
VKAVEVERRERVARKAALVVRGNFMVLCALCFVASIEEARGLSHGHRHRSSSIVTRCHSSSGHLHEV